MTVKTGKTWMGIAGAVVGLYGITVASTAAVAWLALTLGVAHEWWAGPGFGGFGGFAAGFIACGVFRLVTGRSILASRNHTRDLRRRNDELEARVAELRSVQS